MRQNPNILPGETFDVDADEEEEEEEPEVADETIRKDLDELGDAGLSDDEKELGVDANETHEQRCVAILRVLY